jgi:hypothetical protein
MMQQEDPLVYFEECYPEESLILELLLDPIEAIVCMTIDYAAEVISESTTAKGIDAGELRHPLSPPRDFRRFCFEGVDSVCCNGEKFKPWILRQFTNVIPKKKPPVITFFEVSGVVGRYSLKIKAQKFGPYEFDFKRLSCLKRLGKHKNSKNRDEYIDIESGETFDFFVPFGKIEDKGIV